MSAQSSGYGPAGTNRREKQYELKRQRFLERQRRKKAWGKPSSPAPILYEDFAPLPGNAAPLARIPVGTIVHNVELKPGKGAQIARSAGAFVQIVGRDQGYTTLRLMSGEQRRVLGTCMASIGAVSNPDHANVNLGKAGRSRWLGIRPHTRGVAMNPIDHPHGGGEGRTSGGRHPVTPWGKPTKGKRTRRNKQTDKFIVRSRHAKK